MNARNRKMPGPTGYRPVLIASLSLLLTVSAGHLLAAAPQAPAPQGSSRGIIVRFADTAAGANALTHPGTTQLTDEEAGAHMAARLSRRYRINFKVDRKLATGAYLLKADQMLSERRLRPILKALRKDRDLEYAEPDLLMHAHRTPDDTSYPAQWNYHEALAGINLPQAWDINTGGGVVVAVLDTGQTDHADLLPNILPGYDFISDTFLSRDGDGRDSDPRDEGDWTAANECGPGAPATASSWHGTHVAGTIAAATHNGLGVAGIAYGAMIQHVRVLGRCGGFTSDIADAIVWASGGAVAGVPPNATPARVINLSLGEASSCGATYQSAINLAVANGASVITSAGNSDADASNYQPASCANTITVAASDRDGARAYYSNYGAVIDITAPGGGSSGGILSTLNTGTTVPAADTYGYYLGTSMAASHVSGVAAILYSIAPTLTPAQVESLLASTARPLPVSCPEGCGAGLLDAGAAALVAYANRPPPDDHLALRARFAWSCSSLDCTFTDASTGYLVVTTYSWDFGDATGSVLPNPAHSYAAPGTYAVTLTVADGVTASDSYTAVVRVD